jgi:hypothetical protein
MPVKQPEYPPNGGELEGSSKAVSGTRWIVTVVGATAGLYFAVLCAFSIGAVVLPRHVPKAYAVIFALVTACLGYLGIRAAVVGSSDA